MNLIKKTLFLLIKKFEKIQFFYPLSKICGFLLVKKWFRLENFQILMRKYKKKNEKFPHRSEKKRKNPHRSDNWSQDYSHKSICFCNSWAPNNTSDRRFNAGSRRIFRAAGKNGVKIIASFKILILWLLELIFREIGRSGKARKSDIINGFRLCWRRKD